MMIIKYGQVLVVDPSVWLVCRNRSALEKKRVIECVVFPFEAKIQWD